MKHKALGCHVFAGGFTMGVRKVFDVHAQLEVHGLGRDTVESLGIEFVCDADWRAWFDRKDLYEGAAMSFGNPRCTGFSCMSAGHDETVHGAWSKPTKDIHELCEFSIEAGIPIVCWESVQQAMTVGRELLDYLRDDLFQPAHYRIAHVLVNAASFGNAQHRKRYFFFAYRDDLKFNIMKPELPERHTTVGDVLLDPFLLNRETCEGQIFSSRVEYHPDMYRIATPDEKASLAIMRPGEDINALARHRYDDLLKVSPKYADTWDLRMSEMPFSMHSIAKLNRDRACPTISSSAGRFIHPTLDRLVTIRELAVLMGWPKEIVPLGPHPLGQIGKGIVPDVGTWLAQQAAYCLDGEWGDDDWESRYDERAGEWVGTDFTHDQFKPVEKTFHLTRYCPEKPR